ncbi:hypothetical protein P7C73_g5109, partial [Tremellales sp. Uapishka_1]
MRSILSTEISNRLFSRRLIEFQARCMDAFACDALDETLVEEMEDMLQAMSTIEASGLLNSSTRETAQRVTSNLILIGGIILSKDDFAKAQVDDLVNCFNTCALNNSGTLEIHSPPPATNKHAKRVFPFTSYGCSRTAIRDWMLRNLSCPYISPDERLSLAKVADVTPNKLDSSLTNLRRRSKYLDIKDKWARGDVERMRTLIRNYEKGKEKRPECIADIEKCKDYLSGRENTKVSGWVAAVTPDAKRQKRVANRSSMSSLSSSRSISSSSSSSASSYCSTSTTSSLGTPYEHRIPFSFEPYHLTPDPHFHFGIPLTVKRSGSEPSSTPPATFSSPTSYVTPQRSLPNMDQPRFQLPQHYEFDFRSPLNRRVESL